MEKIIITNSVQETKKLAKELSKELKGGEIIGLVGDLGSGKTTFVQGLAQGLGIKEAVTSPTFQMMKYFLIKSNFLKGKYLYHWDLYRLQDKQDLDSLALDDYLGKIDSICVVEWAEKIIDLIDKFSPKAIWVKFQYKGETKRKIQVQNKI